MKRIFNFGDIEITTREILASISIIAVMILIGTVISGKISEKQIDANEIYNKAIRIDSADLFQYGMETNVGNAFIYGDLEAVDTVSYPDIDGEYMYLEKVKERYEKHKKRIEDDDGNVTYKTYYQWDTDSRESIHSNEISFLGITFPYGKIAIPSEKYIDTVKSDREWSWQSDEMVKVRHVYYGVDTKYAGTVFTNLRDGTISDSTQFYADRTIDETVEHLKNSGGTVLFWVFWIIFICVCVIGFYYLDNKWLE